MRERVESAYPLQQPQRTDTRHLRYDKRNKINYAYGTLTRIVWIQVSKPVSPSRAAPCGTSVFAPNNAPKYRAFSSSLTVRGSSTLATYSDTSSVKMNRLGPAISIVPLMGLPSATSATFDATSSDAIG